MTDRAAYMRAYRARNRGIELERGRAQARNPMDRDRERRPPRAFVGVDGEGGNIDGRHEYLLLRAGEHKLYTGKPLGPMECLRFLAALPAGPIYVGFFFDYDVTMILRDLPPAKVARILDREGRTGEGRQQPYPVDVGPYQVDYIPHKQFRVRQGSRPWVTISDVGPFYQCAFVKALDRFDIGTAEERAQIAEGKEKRATFGALTVGADRYNELEIKLLEQLMETFRGVCQDAGYVPVRWEGPGWIASRMLARNGVPKTRDVPLPPGVSRASRAAFYGGRFETTVVGNVPGPVYQYDINSAYPAACLDLPCLQHARWVQRPPTGGELGLCHLRFEPTEQANLYGFPIRSDDGYISFPAAGSGWYWTVEMNTACHQRWEVDDAWTLLPGCECEPYGFIRDVYAERLRIGKGMRGIPLKLALNSLYGKTCQSIGSAPYANPVYASLITAMTRARLGALAHEGKYCCRDAYMLATDGLFSGPRPVEDSKDLGGWERTVHPDGIFIVQPGLYFTGEHDQPKTRGVPRQVIVEHADDFRAAWRRAIETQVLYGREYDVSIGTVTVPLHSFTGLRLAHARGKPQTAGEWVDVQREISFHTPKRVRTRMGPGRLITDPPDGGAESVPYDKDIGRFQDAERLAGADDPDWAEMLYGRDL